MQVGRKAKTFCALVSFLRFFVGEGAILVLDIPSLLMLMGPGQAVPLTHHTHWWEQISFTTMTSQQQLFPASSSFFYLMFLKAYFTEYQTLVLRKIFSSNCLLTLDTVRFGEIVLRTVDKVPIPYIDNHYWIELFMPKGRGIWSLEILVSPPLLLPNKKIMSGKYLSNIWCYWQRQGDLVFGDRIIITQTISLIEQKTVTITGFMENLDKTVIKRANSHSHLISRALSLLE